MQMFSKFLISVGNAVSLLLETSIFVRCERSRCDGSSEMSRFCNDNSL